MDEQELDNDLDLEGIDESDGSDDTGDGADGAPQDDSGDEPKGEAKRIRDLMSRAQKAEAEVARLKKAPQQKPKPRDRQAGETADEYTEFAREHTRQMLFDSDPRLAQAGLTLEDIAGKSVAEMKASFEAKRKLIDGLQATIRQQVLEEHGLVPDFGGGAGRDADIEALVNGSDEDFDKLLAKRTTAFG